MNRDFGGELELDAPVFEDPLGLRGLWAELNQDESDGPDRPLQELFECKTGIDRWIDGEAWLHINYRVGAGLLDVKPYELCAGLKNSARPGERRAPKKAIRLRADVQMHSFGDRVNRLGRPVLIRARQFVYHPKNVTVEVPLSLEVLSAMGK